MSWLQIKRMRFSQVPGDSTVGPLGATKLRAHFHTPPVSTVRLPHTLRCANISIIDHKECEHAYPGNITDTMVCASVQKEGKDSCQVSGQGPGLQAH